MTYSVFFMCMPPKADICFTMAICSAFSMHKRTGIPKSNIYFVVFWKLADSELADSLRQAGFNVLRWEGNFESKYGRLNKIQVIDWLSTKVNTDVLISVDPDIAFVCDFDFEKELSMLMKNNFHVAITQLPANTLGKFVKSARQFVDHRHSPERKTEYAIALEFITSIGLSEEAMRKHADTDSTWINGGMLLVTRETLKTAWWPKLVKYAFNFWDEEFPFWCLGKSDSNFKIRYLEKPFSVVTGDNDRLHRWLIGEGPGAHIIHFYRDAKKSMESYYVAELDRLKRCCLVKHAASS